MLALDVLEEEASVAVGLLVRLSFLRWNVVDSECPVVQIQSQALGLWVVLGPLYMRTGLQLERLIHYLTFLSLGFLAFAAGLAFRVADAKMAPADFLL